MLVVGAMASLVFSAVAIAAAGDLDPTFSGDGKQRTDFGAGPSAAEAAVRQTDGKIVAVGRGPDANFLVARYNPNGSLDPGFSGDGSVQTNFIGFDAAADVALQGNKIVVVGFSSDGTNSAGHFALARYNPDGSLDTSFSGDGKQTTPFSSQIGGATGVALQADGKIVAVGSAGPGLDSRFALARYRLNGSLDTSFAGDGKQTTGFPSSGEFDYNAAFDVAVQGNGKIVAVGETGNASAEAFALARYNPNGSLDTSFAGDGRQTTVFGGFNQGAGAVAIQANDRIVAAGSADSGGPTGFDFALARYSANGSLDTSFAGDGRQSTDFLFGAEDGANDVAIQANGRIVAVGFASGGATGFDFALARYDPNGSLDPGFSGDGRKRTSFAGGGGTVFDVALGVALQGDGRIVAVGEGNEEFALARYLGG